MRKSHAKGFKAFAYLEFARGLPYARGPSQAASGTPAGRIFMPVLVANSRCACLPDAAQTIP